MTQQKITELEVLMTIADYSLRRTLSNIFQDNKVPLLFLTHGFGTADSKVYELLGYGEPKKIITISIQTKKWSHNLLQQLQNKLNFYKRGGGIAFTINLSSITGSALAVIERQIQDNQQIGSEDMDLQSRVDYHLIISIVNTGFFEQVMEAAKSAGATGGTLIHARGLGSREAVKYLGITIQPEKDLVFILAPGDKRTTIMESIISQVGINDEGNGICFSLPVNRAEGLDRYQLSGE